MAIFSTPRHQLYPLLLLPPITLLLLTPSGSTHSAQRCPDCGATLVPYPLSTGPTCGDQSYKLSCNGSSLLFRTINNTYPVTSISPQIQRLTIQLSPFLPNICVTADISTRGVQLDSNLPFSITRSNTIFYLNCSESLLHSHLNCSSTSLCHTFLNGSEYGGRACRNSGTCCSFRSSGQPGSYSIRVRNEGCRAYRSFINLDYSLPVSRWPQPGLELQWDPPGEPVCKSQTDCNPVSTCKTDPISGSGRCLCNTGFHWDTVAGLCVKNETCQDSDVCHSTRTGLIAGVLSAIGVLILVATSFILYKLVKRRRDKMIKEKFFKRNGGLLLQQQLSADDTVMNKTRIFTATELDRATDHFNENRVLGQGAQGTVYKGMLADGNLAAIKKSKKVDESQLRQFINEVVILSQVNHRNVVKLLGCCLETEVPMLVYEYIPNGTLYGLIHNENDDDEFPFTWSLRLRIAAEVAGALAYLHSAISVPVYHRDIKSSNILLNEKHIAKVSDFGISTSISIDKTHLTTMVKGTFGYFDPEYFQSNQFTEKSDVYSFGVVLVELLTRRKPISAESEEDSPLSLASRFLTVMDENHLDAILDPQLQDQRTEEVSAVAELSRRCLNLNGRNRPTMKEVATELDSIKISANQSTNHANSESQELKKENSKSAAFSDTNPSWTSSHTHSITLNLASYPNANTF